MQRRCRIGREPNFREWVRRVVGKFGFGAWLESFGFEGLSGSFRTIVEDGFR